MSSSERRDSEGSDRKRPRESSSSNGSDAEAMRLEELRRKRQAKVQAMKLADGLPNESAAAPASAPGAEQAAGAAATDASRRDGDEQQEGGQALPDDADGEEAAYFDGEAVAAGGGVDEDVPASIDASRGANGSADHRPWSVASTVEPDERADALEAYMSSIAAQAGALQRPQPEANSRCVLLEHMLSPAEAADEQELHATRMDTGRECERWGQPLRVHAVGAFDPDGELLPEAVAGRIFVEFEESESAAECARAMDGRFFDGRRISATFYPVEAFLEGDFARDGAVLQQTVITMDDIVAMNSRPASSWDTMANVAGPPAPPPSSHATGEETAESSANTEDGPAAMMVEAAGALTAAASSAVPEAAAKGAQAEDDDEPSEFHQEFMRAMRAQAAEAARQASHASTELLEGNDDAMDALVEEFPDAAERVEAPEADDDDDEDREESVLAARAKKKEIAKVDHATMDYAAVRKAFYIEVPEIKNLTDAQVEEMRKELDGIKVRGKRCPRPIRRWAQCGLSDRLLSAIDKAGYAKPFPIQAQTLPAIMSGRDVIGIAKTGSGKTMGYTLPMLRHVMDQPPLASGDGPISLVMVPTRELAMQVYREVSKLAKVVGLSTAAVYGGANLKQQIAELKRGAHIVICTPGRMIDMLTANSGRVTNLTRVTYVVLDEADRMFDMGFAPQIDRIVGNVRPDRQTVLFSATFPQAVERLARAVLTKPVQIIVGGISVVSNTIEQHVEVLPTEGKLGRLCQLLRQYYEEGQQLVFVDTQEACDALFRELLKQNLPCSTLHGGMGQDDRDSTIADFKSGNLDLLVATSVAARGLDVKGLALVVNYEVPNHYEDYVHRVGRTGRAGNTGTAYTFLTPDEEKYAPDLVKAMEAAGQEAPDDIVCMANAYKAKKDAGSLLAKDLRQNSFKSGKGLSLDADAIAKDEKSRRDERRRAQRAAGVVVDDGDESDEDEKAVINKATGAPASASNSSAAASSSGHAGVAAAAAQAAKILQTQLGNITGANAAAAEVQKKILEAAKMAKTGTGSSGGDGAVAATASAAGGAAIAAGAELGGQVNACAAAAAAGAAALLVPGCTTGVPSVVDVAQQVKQQQRAKLPAAVRAKLEKLEAEAKIKEQKKQEEAAAAAAEAAARLAELQPAKKERFTAELEINDYPQAARIKVANKEVMGGISEFTRAAITNKGQFYPPGRNPPAGERKLFLYIEGESEAAVKAARKELRRMLDEHSAIAAPAEENRYSRYRI